MLWSLWRSSQQFIFKCRFLFRIFCSKFLNYKLPWNETALIKHFFDRVYFWELDNKHRVFVDVGAQVGWWTLPYARDGWQVFGFEASPFNYEMYAKKFAPYKNVHPVYAAVSDEHGKKITFYYSEKYIGVNSMKLNHPLLKEGKTIEANTVRLDQYLPPYVTQIDLIKIDIEGADLLALKSLNLNEFKPTIIILEFGLRSRHFGYEPKDIFTYMASFDYQAFVANYESASEGPYDRTNSLQQRHPKLIEFSKYTDLKSDLNWGEAIFVRTPYEAEFRKTFCSFVGP